MSRQKREPCQRTLFFSVCGEIAIDAVSEYFLSGCVPRTRLRFAEQCTTGSERRRKKPTAFANWR